MSTAIITRGLVGCAARRQQTWSSISSRKLSKISQRNTTTTSNAKLHLNGSSATIIGTTRSAENPQTLLNLGVAATTACLVVAAAVLGETTSCSARARTTGTDVLMLEPHKEPATGILYPHLCNALTFVGCGVRVKYGFVKVCV